MERKLETDKNMKSQATESMENPFIKLAPELVAHILSYLYSLPSRMSASGVCRLWSELVNWKEVKQLNLDFGQLHINKVPLGESKWSAALESLLPKVKLTSLKVHLPSQALPKPTEPGLYLVWPLSLLDCGVAVNELNASLSSITHFCISGHPTNPQFEFSCHLLELCPSVTHLCIKLDHDNFDQRLLQSSLRNKPLQQLDIKLSHLTLNSSGLRLAQLCRVLAPGTLKSLTLNTGADDDTDHEYIFSFVQFCRALQTNAGCLSALECLTIAAPRLLVAPVSVPVNVIQLWAEEAPFLMNHVFPKLQSLHFIAPACSPASWLLLQSMLLFLSDNFNRPLQVTLSTSHCAMFGVYADLKHYDPYLREVKITEQGFSCTKMREETSGNEPPIEFHFKRLPSAACICQLCRLEYGLLKQQIIDRLNAEASSEDPIRVFECQVAQLKVDLMEKFPKLVVSETRTEKAALCVELMDHNAMYRNGSCAGCAMLQE